MRSLRTLHRNEDGAVTVDWVVLTALIVGLCLSAMATMRSGMQSGSNVVKNGIASHQITTTF